MSVTRTTLFDNLKTDISPVAVALVVKAYDANERIARSNTLTRGDVSGGGKKPWRQKGTGRARVGSTRNPVWRTGGVAHGPKKERNYMENVNDSTKRAALKAVILDAAQAKTLFTVNAWPTDGKAKSVIDAIRDEAINATKILLLHGNMSASTLARAAQNIDGVSVQSAVRVTVRDLIRANQIIADDAAWQVIAKRIKADAASETKPTAKRVVSRTTTAKAAK